MLASARCGPRQACPCATAVKHEFPEPGLPLPRDDELPPAGQGTAEEVPATAPGHAATPPPDPLEAAIHTSPFSSAERASTPAVASTTVSRRDIYRVPSSPEFMHQTATPDKPAKTYGRSPQSGADLLNMARRLGRGSNETGPAQHGSHPPMKSNARPFQRTQLDEIESTPRQATGSGHGEESHVAADSRDDVDDVQDLTASFPDTAAEATNSNTQTPVRKTGVKPAKPGSLKKPSRASLTTITTPASTKRGAKPKVVATPASTTAKKPAVKQNTTTPPTLGLSRAEKPSGQETISRMERLERLLNASQNTPKRQGNAASPARSGSARSHDRSNRSSPEVRIPTVKKAMPVDASAGAKGAQLPVPNSVTQRTPLKSPVPLPPSSTQKSISACAITPDSTKSITPHGSLHEFKRPAAKAQKSPALSSSVKQASAVTPTSTPRRSEIPLPPNVRHLRRSSSLQSSPLPNGNSNTVTSDVSMPAQTLAKGNEIASQPIDESSSNTVAFRAESISAAKPTNGVNVNPSVESSPPRNLDSENDKQSGSPDADMDGATEKASAPAKFQTRSQKSATAKPPKASEPTADQPLDQPEYGAGQNNRSSTLTVPPQSQDKPSSRQGSSQALPWSPESWSFGHLGHVNPMSDKPEKGDKPQGVPAAASNPEDEGFAEQEIYSTAVEDNASKSRSSSAAASTRSSPAVSRQPARFLSHSPTPDASDSEGVSDDASPPHSRPGSPPPLGKEDSESESDSSSDSSDDEEVDMPDVQHATSTSESHTKAASEPDSSPPQPVVANSTSLVPEPSQSTPSRTTRPLQQTPVLPPTQQSSQAPQSSQSVSVQAADRRRYTGFRSLREQLADTKAAQASTQKKPFDPRTMNLGKLVKGKPLVGLGGNDEDSSDDESSSSSSSSSSDDDS
ncbi:hypothetical protein OPT61_g9492 [Boeremia exigua]|uniref:Uncharacterized protein n=1 Tax=Boeremia exigua TaxID=749465 RepID=A0ACC2HUD3_9PLEO|nr:hypothetical protein OPT61_g9492 [Boeremia exigua]